MPSFLPSKPRCSVVVALIVTSSVSIPNTPARQDCIFSTYLPIFGDCNAIVESIFSISKPFDFTFAKYLQEVFYYQCLYIYRHYLDIENQYL